MQKQFYLRLTEAKDRESREKTGARPGLPKRILSKDHDVKDTERRE